MARHNLYPKSGVHFREMRRDINDIIEQLKLLKLIPGRGVQLTETPNGTVLSLSAEQRRPILDDSGYQGIFKVVLGQGENENGEIIPLIRVIDGRDINNVNCGTVRLRNSDAPGSAPIRIPLTVAEIPVDPEWRGSQVIALVVAYDTEQGQYTAVIEPRRFANPSADEFVYPIGYYQLPQGLLRQEIDLGPYVDDFDLSQLVWS